MQGTSSHRAHQGSFHGVIIGRRAQRILWMLLIAVQAASAAILTRMAYVYFDRNRRNSFLWVSMIYYVFSDEYDFLDANSLLIATTYMTIAVLFGLLALTMLAASLVHRDAAFGGIRDEVRRRVQPAPTASDAGIHPHGRLTRLHGSMRQIHKLKSAIGVDGQYFELRFLFEQVVGLVSQTIAAYSSSRSISNVLLNQTYGFVIFINAISPIVYARVFSDRVVVQRLACLFTDMLLDFIWGVMIPTWMCLPLLQMEGYSIVLKIQNSEALPRTIARILVVSWPGFLLTLVPLYTSLLNSIEIQSTMTKLARSPATICAAPITVAPVMVTPPQVTTTTVAGKVWLKWVRRVIALYGSVVFVISLAASDVFYRVPRAEQYLCIARVHPWLTWKEACIVRHVNCTEAGITGQADDLEASFNLFDESSLSDIVFADCPALELPSAVSHFDHLLTITIANSWITDWPASAAVTATSFPGLKSIKLLNSDTNTTLVGLVAQPISTSIEYIRFEDVPSAAQILDAVGTNWQHLIYLDCDGCSLTAVPPVVDSMYQLLTLSLMGSDVQEFRDDWIIHWNLQLLGIWLDGNTQLTTLSDVVWNQAATSDKFSMQFTNLSAVPAWVPNVASAGFTLYAFGSPLCDVDSPAYIPEDDSIASIISCEYFEE